MQLLIEVENCNDCPCKKSTTEHGATLLHCSHIGAPMEYDNVLNRDKLDVVPKWCPINTTILVHGDCVAQLKNVVMTQETLDKLKEE